MLNPMQILGMMSNMKNPQQMVMNIAKQNPQMNMAMQMMCGVKDKKGMKQLILPMIGSSFFIISIFYFPSKNFSTLPITASRCEALSITSIGKPITTVR